MYSKPNSLTGPVSGREFSGRARDLGFEYIDFGPAGAGPIPDADAPETLPQNNMRCVDRAA